MPTTTDGIVYPDLDSPGDDLPAHFAVMATTTQAALDDIHDDVEAVSEPATITQATFGTPAAGVSVEFFALRRVGKLLSGSMKLVRSAGMAHAQAQFTVASAFRPAIGELLPLPGIHSGGAASQAGGTALQPTGAITVLNPGDRTTLEVAISWIIA